MRPASRLLKTYHLGLVATTAWCVLAACVLPGLLDRSVIGSQAAAATAGNIVPVEEAAAWLTEQLEGGLLSGPNPDLTQYYASSVDASIDAALSLTQIVGYDATVAEIRGAVVAEGHDFAHPVSVLNDPVGQAFLIGPTAKLASFAYRTGLNARSFGNPSADLVEEIIDSIDIEGAQVGRVRDRFVDASVDDGVAFDGTDRADVLALGWSIDAVIRARDDLAPADQAQLNAPIDAMVSYLRQQQCAGSAGGFFRASFNAEPCDSPATQSRVPNNLVTARIALILQDLAEAGLLDSQLTTTLDELVAWLQFEQNVNGSFGEVKDSAAHTQTTGWAGLALWRAGDVVRGQLAGTWLRGVQWFDPVPCGESTLLAALGAVAPDKETFRLAKDAGPGPSLGWRRATSGAIPLLRFTPFKPGPPTLSAPTGFVHAGARVQLAITHTDDNERLCLSGPKLAGKSIPVDEPVEVTTIVAPAGTANRVYRVAAIDGGGTAVLRVLDSTTFKVRAKFRSVRRGAKQKIVVSGLAPGERVRIRVNGKTVAKGKANVNGKFKKRFKVKTRKGKARVSVRGRFDDRTGRTRFRVR